MFCISGKQIIAHFVGDYLLQSDWVAENKYKNFLVALIHAILYTIPFIFITTNLLALSVICITHALIDRYKLARYVAWARNWIAPVRPKSWKECCFTGYNPDRPLWISVWLMIIVDNLMHIIVNAVAISLFG